MNAAQLAKAVGCSTERAAKWLPHLDAAMRNAGIDTVREQASFLAQLAHESSNLSRLEENLNYSADGLAATWPSRYRDPATRKPNKLALALHRRPTAIANNCYANRMGNGDEASGDGWRYRGRGPIQITGRQNYLLCGIAIEADLIEAPELLLQPEYGAKSAAWFWFNRNLDRFDDDDNVADETRIINGGTLGLAERQMLMNRALAALQGD